ncbi:ATP-binding protein [Vibrio parahaemolyticus]|uniref:ATP-binding protein n=1 Tax=Vibrio parahaemolyticus TaxID=670 RepID=UPI0006B27AB6|nr:ATP-binding protein [Vibrio parahaemolyticus]KOY34060.1 phosphate ABC transporter ATPase [Vibrio parahaemolyticus]MCR9876086.1 ATP-binding protein [Vibrio parahaemolyticus]TOZ88208.1 ATP-binding protein [Vibrio parahaemolyticus]
MEIQLKGTNEYNGFLLEKTAVLNNKITVLTGKNGSGKTRLIESIQNRHTSTYIDGNLIENKDIRYVKQASLNPNFGANYNDTQYQNKITSTLQLYDRIKNDLDLPLDPQKAQSYMRSGDNNGLRYDQLFKLCLNISKEIGKPASELTHDDIIFHFEEPSNDILGIQSISTIANQYIKRLHQNELNEWKSTQKGFDVSYFNREEFISKFGDKPWVLINRILEDTFDGKFQFSIPDEESMSYNYQARLIHCEDLSSVSVEHLSSGEKTLLWLALTLFNTQYYDAEFAHAPKILLIDEPDAFLHPKMVLKMYQALESFESNFSSIVVISTHSPTTVALSPSDSVLLVENNSIRTIEKDEAISELLDGVTQISMSPQNRRQVYVESQYDADVYQCIYSKLVHSSDIIDSKISLNFVSSGPKMPRQQLIDKARQILKITDDATLNEFADSVNGVGNCVQVVGQVESLINNENESVRGIIDWDLKNTPQKGISVLAKDYAYSIENITLDPICILLLLNIDKNYTMTDICGSDVNWDEFIADKSLLQEGVDRFVLKVLGRDNKKDSPLVYTSGIELLTDSEYLTMNGHNLEVKVKEQYPELRGYCKKGKDGELKYSIVSKAMIRLTNGKFIPCAYERVIAEIQK